MSVITVKNLTIGYDSKILLKGISFDVMEKDIFVIIGKSGCGKSTLLRNLIGLQLPKRGEIWIGKEKINDYNSERKNDFFKKIGVLFQGGALFTSMTIFENIAFPFKIYTTYSDKRIKELVKFKLSLVGLSGFEEYYPYELSGGMKKRAAFARALALDPEIVYLDEPSAGLDPEASRIIDDLIIKINEIIGTTVVLVSHELSSIYTVGSNGIFLGEKRILASGNPYAMLKNTEYKEVKDFLTRKGDKYV